MTIMRNGIEIELTGIEMLRVFEEMDKNYLIEDIQGKADAMGIDLDNVDINMIVDEVQSTLGQNDSYWEAYWMSIAYVLEELTKH